MPKKSEKRSSSPKKTLFPILDFPDPREAIGSDLIAVGGNLLPETLVAAYSQGLFPWPSDDHSPIPWASPEQRGVLFFKDVVVSSRLERYRKTAFEKEGWKITIDQAFSKVIGNCALAKRLGQDSTWITQAMQESYVELHSRGLAHSVETWDAKGNLIGGLYGVCIRGVFAGESMFFLEANASKFALLHLIEKLREQKSTWMDIQMLTPHMEKLGAKVIPRDAFLTLLAQTQALHLELFPPQK